MKLKLDEIHSLPIDCINWSDQISKKFLTEIYKFSSLKRTVEHSHHPIHFQNHHEQLSLLFVILYLYYNKDVNVIGLTLNIKTIELTSTNNFITEHFHENKAYLLLNISNLQFPLSADQYTTIKNEYTPFLYIDFNSINPWLWRCLYFRYVFVERKLNQAKIWFTNNGEFFKSVYYLLKIIGMGLAAASLVKYLFKS